MITLSIHRLHDANLTLVSDGRVLLVVEAERISNQKHASGTTFDSIMANIAFMQTGIDPSQVDAVVVCDENFEDLSPGSKDFKFSPNAAVLEHTHQGHFLAKLGQASGAPLGILGLRPEVPVFGACHNVTHAVGALYMSGFNECVILVYDGYGFCCGTMAYVYKDNKLTRLDHWRNRFLIGWRYSVLGTFLRELSSTKNQFLDNAGKIMGLSSYGKSDRKLVDYFKGWYRKEFDEYLVCYQSHTRNGRRFFDDLLGADALRYQAHSVNDRHIQDLFASAQDALSEVVGEAISELIQETGIHNIVLSGGCALNVVANSAVAGNSSVKSLFIQPNCSDCGTSMGGAILGDSLTRNRPLHHPEIDTLAKCSPYLGLALVDDPACVDLPDGISRRPFDLTDKENLQTFCGMLDAQKIIGFVYGRSEIGPRALGHRSILTSVRDPKMKDILNEKVKHREWWRPFAPICRDVDTDVYFDIPAPSPYMLYSGSVRQEYRDRIGAITHVDYSARVQSLPNREYHPILWDILTALKDLSGIGVLLNTSFNQNGRPLLNTSSQAVEMLAHTGLDACWINGFLFQKALQ